MKPVWISGYFDNKEDAAQEARQGLEGDATIEALPIPALTLDQIEAWLQAEQDTWSRDREEVFIDLLAQVQAWKEGKQ